MNEGQFRSRCVKPVLEKAGLYLPVENSAMPGTPDVYFKATGCHGCWIELKHKAVWPARATTVVKFDHFTPQQRVWHTTAANEGVETFVMVRIKDEVFLFDGEEAAIGLGSSWTSKDIRSKAICSCKRKPDDVMVKRLSLPKEAYYGRKYRRGN